MNYKIVILIVAFALLSGCSVYEPWLDGNGTPVCSDGYITHSACNDGFKNFWAIITNFILKWTFVYFFIGLGLLIAVRLKWGKRITIAEYFTKSWEWLPVAYSAGIAYCQETKL